VKFQMIVDNISELVTQLECFTTLYHSTVMARIDSLGSEQALNSSQVVSWLFFNRMN